MKIVANLTFLFTELPFMERFEAARKAGFDAVEFMFPYDYDLEEIAACLKENDLELVLFNLPAGDWGAGDRGIAVNPDRREEFRKGVAQAIDAAAKLGVNQINCLVGKKNSEQTDAEAMETLKENISYAAGALAEHKLNLLLEPINHFDIPGFFLNTTTQVLEIITELNSPNVFLQYDVYHAAREDENLLAILRNYLPRIGHIQVADNPGRHQPGSGDIDYKTIFSELGQSGYDRYVALEYIPEPDTVTSLKWLADFGWTIKA